MLYEKNKNKIKKGADVRTEQDEKKTFNINLNEMP